MKTAKHVSTAVCAASAVAMMVASPAYAAPVHGVPADATFAAHVEHRGLVVDRGPTAEPAVLVSTGSLFSQGPNYRLEAGGQTVAALWVKNLAHVTVRRTTAPADPVIGRVAATWEGGALRLRLEPGNGEVLQTGRFHRIDGPGSPEVLTENISTTLDERGAYVATLRDSVGRSAGWLRIGISPFESGRRVYSALLPSTVSEPLATAAVALINTNLRDLEGHALDVHPGN